MNKQSADAIHTYVEMCGCVYEMYANTHAVNYTTRNNTNARVNNS